MKGIIANTEEINNRASTIAADLYVFCNFSNEGYSHVSAEGEFHNKVMLLYNIIHDTSIVFQHVRKILCVNSEDNIEWKKVRKSINFFTYKEHYDIICKLRSCAAHNTSALNGAIEKKEILFYENWKTQCCGKKNPDSIEDYKKMVSKLNEYDEFLYKWIGNLLDYIDTSPDKFQIIANWRKEIIRWYCTKRNIFYGQLEDMYNCLYIRKNNKSPENKNGIIFALEDWICNTYCETWFVELKKLDNLFSCVGKIGLAENKCLEMKKKIEEKKVQICEEMGEKVYNPIIRYFHLKEKCELTSKDYVEYFFQHDLELLINEEIMSGKCKSLLPQDVLQLIISERFMEVTFNQLVCYSD